MTNLVCPLCGRRVNMANFDPSNFDLDVYAVEVTGLGHGRGFKEIEQYSILNPDDENIILIKDRILALAKLLADNDCLNIDEVLSTLNVEKAYHEKTRKLEGEIEALEAEQEEEYDTLRGLTQRITEFLEEEYDFEVDPEKEPMKAIKERVDTMLKDYGETCDTIRAVISQIKEAIGEEYEFADEYLEQSLRTHVNVLIEEYESMEAEEEKEEDE